jgi:hypothetical protein
VFSSPTTTVAGHGDQITNLDGTEDDGKDESEYARGVDSIVEHAANDRTPVILPIDWKLDITLKKEDRERYTQIIIDDVSTQLLHGAQTNFKNRR